MSRDISSDPLHQALAESNLSEPRWGTTRWLLVLILLAGGGIAWAVWGGADASGIAGHHGPPSYTLDRDPDLVRLERLAGAEPQEDPVDLEPVAQGHVRVAALQFLSRFDEQDENRRRLLATIQRASMLGAKIVVLPEMSLPGYVNLDSLHVWAIPPLPEFQEDNPILYEDINMVAQPVDGPLFQRFSRLARELEIYIVLPFAERGEGRLYYSTALLIAPNGQIVLHARKQTLWETGDTHWATAGAPGAAVTETPYGRVGIAISQDLPKVLPQMHEQGVDLVLVPAALYGPEVTDWIRRRAPVLAKKAGAALVIANWASSYDARWSGYGLSRILAEDGTLLAAQAAEPGETIVLADLPVQKEYASQNEKKEQE